MSDEMIATQDAYMQGYTDGILECIQEIQALYCVQWIDDEAYQEIFRRFNLLLRKETP